MGLKLKELQQVVKKVVKEEKHIEAFAKEVSKVFGPTILTTHGLKRMAESLNDHIDVLDATGRSYGSMRPSLLIKFAGSEHPEVRRLVARLLPESFLKSMTRDRSASVRSVLARRLHLNDLSEMVKRFPNDDNIKYIERSRRLTEAGLPNPKIEDEEFDMYGEEPMGAATEDLDHDTMSDTWYKTVAHKIVKDYGGNIEGQWEEIAVKRYCDSMRSMGVEVDAVDLLDAVFEILEEREDAVLEETSLSNVAKKLLREDTTVMPILSDKIDPVRALAESSCSPTEYIKKFEDVFSVKYSKASNPSYKLLGEGSQSVVHPSSAIQLTKVTRGVDERAVDNYVAAWNKKYSMQGENYRISWSPDPFAAGLVNFHLELK